MLIKITQIVPFITKGFVLSLDRTEKYHLHHYSTLHQSTDIRCILLYIYVFEHFSFQISIMSSARANKTDERTPKGKNLRKLFREAIPELNIPGKYTNLYTHLKIKMELPQSYESTPSRVAENIPATEAPRAAKYGIDEVFSCRPLYVEICKQRNNRTFQFCLVSSGLRNSRFLQRSVNM